MEHKDERAEELEREADKLEQHSEHIGEQIEDVRKDWESKAQDQHVPGAQPPLDEQLEDDEDEDEQNTGNPDAAGSEE